MITTSECNDTESQQINSTEISIAEVIFKAGRIGIYANPANLELNANDHVIVEADKGYDLGRVTLRGSTYNGYGSNEELKKIVRKASEDDLAKLEENREKEDQAVRSCKTKIIKHQLNMNLIDVEYQWDHNKLTFYFTSEERVDFRQLVRELASQYRTRIELRQIGVRDAARHISGYGSCGCQLCCTVFLKKFENITTQYIKDQLIPTNPSRLTGVCGRLKCCLSFERDFYVEELAKYPTVNSKIRTPKGKGYVEKVDIFNAAVYVKINGDVERFSYEELQLETQPA